MYFEHEREVQSIKKYSFLSWKYFSDDLFRATLCWLMLVLHKDVLFHSVFTLTKVILKTSTWFLTELTGLSLLVTLIVVVLQASTKQFL
jgi:hypothetical protein